MQDTRYAAATTRFPTDSTASSSRLRQRTFSPPHPTPSLNLGTVKRRGAASLRVLCGFQAILCLPIQSRAWRQWRLAAFLGVGDNGQRLGLGCGCRYTLRFVSRCERAQAGTGTGPGTWGWCGETIGGSLHS